MTTLVQRIKEILLTHAQDSLPEEAITVDPDTRHHIVGTMWIDNDEIDLDRIAEVIAEGLQPPRSAHA